MCLHMCYSCHIYVTPMHTKPGIKERMLADMRDSARELMAKPKEKLDGRVRKLERAAACYPIIGWDFEHFTPWQAALYGMSQSIPDKGLVQEMTYLFLDALYSTKG